MHGMPKGEPTFSRLTASLSDPIKMARATSGMAAVSAHYLENPKLVSHFKLADSKESLL